MDLSWRPVELALHLARDGVEFVVVGGTARRLLGGQGAPADLDVVVQDVEPVVRSAARLGARSVSARVTPARLTTCFGPLDVFVGQVRITRQVNVHGTVLTVEAAS